MLKRLNRACEFFPCHTGLEDCTFCYCPFYPCLNEERGEYVCSSKNNKKIWSCEPCDWIHKRKVVDDIFELIRENRRPREKFKDGRTGIIVLSHGTKIKKANAILDKIIAKIKQDTGLAIIVPAYLQLCRPDLTKSIKRLAGQGCRRIIIIPFFLFNGNHVTRDIPVIIKKARSEFPEVEFTYTKSLGEDRRVADIISDTLREVLV